MYRLEGETIGSCGCNLSLDCLCWGEKHTDGCGDSFVAYWLKSGTIQGTDVSSLTLVRIVREAEQRSFFYIDAGGNEVQQRLLVQAFAGEFGGVLADLGSIFPNPESPRIAPITYSIAKNRRASLWIGNVLVRQNLRPKQFYFESTIEE